MMDLTGLHDVMVDLLEDRKYEDYEVIECFNKLPDDIKDIAIQWGGGDTVFRDSAYRFIENNLSLFTVFNDESLDGLQYDVDKEFLRSSVESILKTPLPSKDEILSIHKHMLKRMSISAGMSEEDFIKIITE